MVKYLDDMCTMYVYILNLLSEKLTGNSFSILLILIALFDWPPFFLVLTL